jgi:hypothetical protein
MQKAVDTETDPQPRFGRIEVNVSRLELEGPLKQQVNQRARSDDVNELSKLFLQGFLPNAGSFTRTAHLSPFAILQVSRVGRLRSYLSLRFRSFGICPVGGLWAAAAAPFCTVASLAVTLAAVAVFDGLISATGIVPDTTSEGAVDEEVPFAAGGAGVVD